MRAFDIIKKKRDGLTLSKEEIVHMVSGFSRDEIPDYQMAAFCMAIYFRGMSEQETVDLTMAMVESGDRIDLGGIAGIKVDKHSTGGVGDTTTLICAPLAAACGIPVAKMTGRGLGHTGGTLDKLESIPGFRVALSPRDFVSQVNRIGIAVASQTADLVPADKKMYALRDVTATIDSLPLIASSIMSKKLASGADRIVLDVKFGDGAFMKERNRAERLATAMVGIGNLSGKKTVALLTSMEQPLGNYVGNSLEVREAIEVLRGDMAGGDLRELVLALAGCMIYLGGRGANLEDAQKLAWRVLESGKGLEKFAEWIEAQGGDRRVVEDLSLLPKAAIVDLFQSPASGYIRAIKAETIGYAALLLGAGRSRKEDVIDPAVGLILKKRVGEEVRAGEALAEIHASDKSKLESCRQKLIGAYVIDPSPPDPEPLIWKRIGI